MSRRRVRPLVALVAAAGVTAICAVFALHPAVRVAAQGDPPALVGDPAVIAEGRAVFAQNCGTFECHNNYGGGGFMENARKINDEKWYNIDGSYGAILATVTNGISGTPMKPWTGKLAPERMQAVAAYVYLLSRGQAPKE